jgi:hypothetical protein
VQVLFDVYDDAEWSRLRYVNCSAPHAYSRQATSTRTLTLLRTRCASRHMVGVPPVIALM